MITNKVNAILLNSNGTTCYVPFTAELEWDPAEPLSIQMVLLLPDGPVVWTVGRELAFRGVVSLKKVGDGDVRFQKEGPSSSRLLVCFRTPEGHADIALNQPHVVRFLNRTQDACHLGDEDVTAQIDELIDEIYSA